MGGDTSQVESSNAGLLEIDHLSLHHVAAGPERPILRDVSLHIGRQEIVGLVGESGSGKTLTGLAGMGLVPTWARTQGSVRFCGVDLLNARTEELRRLRGRDVSMVFQEPRISLNPTRPVGRSVATVVRSHTTMSRKAASAAVLEMFERVGLPDPGRQAKSYPHELSGGMCQRVAMSMALICRPQLLIADEPTTALDVTIQAQILRLLVRLAREEGLAVLLITHDLGIVSQVCDRMITLYAGEVVEEGDTADVVRAPQHPYTAALLRAAGRADQLDGTRDDTALPPAQASAPPSGCAFHTRCDYRIGACETDHPSLSIASASSSTRCLRHDELELTGVSSIVGQTASAARSDIQ